MTCNNINFRWKKEVVLLTFILLLSPSLAFAQPRQTVSNCVKEISAETVKEGEAISNSITKSNGQCGLEVDRAHVYAIDGFEGDVLSASLYIPEPVRAQLVGGLARFVDTPEGKPDDQPRYASAWTSATESGGYKIKFNETGTAFIAFVVNAVSASLSDGKPYRFMFRKVDQAPDQFQRGGGHQQPDAESVQQPEEPSDSYHPDGLSRPWDTGVGGPWDTGVGDPSDDAEPVQQPEEPRGLFNHRYDSLDLGMSKGEVLDLIGPPDTIGRMPDSDKTLWMYPEGSVFLRDGKVVSIITL